MYIFVFFGIPAQSLCAQDLHFMHCSHVSPGLDKEKSSLQYRQGQSLSSSSAPRNKINK